jgi:LuxR family quorum-sensing system transcriptional regulator CciR
MVSSILNFINNTNAANSSEEVLNFLKPKAAEYGCDMFAFGPSTPEAAKLMTGVHPDLPFIVSYPERWIDHYIKNNYFEIDPVIKLAARSARAFTWKTLKMDPNNSATVNKFWKESELFGLQCGLTVPIHCPQSQSFLLSLASSYKDNCLLCVNIEEVQLLAYQFGLAYIHANTIDKPVKENPLTAREQEVLTWTAQGKSAWDISIILRISEHTVNFHLKNVIKKLGTLNKTAAVVKAMRFGFIYPETYN